MNNANAPPETGRVFYVIEDRDDGCVDVYLMPFHGVKLVVRGVVLPEGQGDTEEQKRHDAVSRLTEDVRARYYAWCESAEITMKGDREHER